MVDALAARVQASQLGERAAGRIHAVLHQLRAAIGRAQPQVARGGVDRQARPGLDVEGRRAHPDLRAVERVDLHDAVARAVVLGEVDAPGASAVGRPGEVVVGVQRQAGDHRPGARVDGQHPVGVGVAVEDQQAARRHAGRAQRHRRAQHLQAQVVVGVGRAEVSPHGEGLQRLAGGRVDLEQVARVGVVAHPELARRVHRHIAQGRAGHIDAHRVERISRARAPGGGDRDTAQPVHGQRGAVEVGAAVLLDAVVVDVDVVGIGRRVADAGAGEVVGAGAFNKARAEQHGAVLDVDVAEGGHDLQQRLAGRAEDLQREGAVEVAGQHQGGAGGIRCGRRGAQAQHLQRAIDVDVAHQHVGAGVEPRAHQGDGLAGVGRGLCGVGGRAAERAAGHAGQAHAVAGAGAAGGLDADGPEGRAGAVQGHGDAHVAVGDVPQRRVVAVEHVRAGVDPRVQHHLAAQPVLAVVALDEAGAQDQHLRTRAVRRDRLHLHVHDGGQDLQREGAIGEIGAHGADLRVHDGVARNGIQRYVEVGQAARGVGAEDGDRRSADGAGAVDDLEAGLGRGRVEGHADADLLAGVGRWRRRDVGDAAERADVAGDADREVAHDGRGQCVAGAVADDGGVDGEAVGARGQDGVEHDAELLAARASVQMQGRGDVVGGAEDAVGASTHDANAGRGQSGDVERLVEADVHRADQEATGTLVEVDVGDLGRESVGNDVENDGVGHRHIAAGVGRTNLNVHAIAATGNGGCLSEELPRIAQVIGDDIAIDQEFDIAHLDVVAHGGHDVHDATFEHLNTGLAGIGVECVDGDVHCGRHALGVETDVVDDLQAARAVGYEGQAAGKTQALGHGGQRHTGEQLAGVGRVRNVQHVEGLGAKRAAGRAHTDREARAVDCNGIARNVDRIGAADEAEAGKVADIDGREAAIEAVEAAHIGHAAAGKDLATSRSQGQGAQGAELAAGNADRAQDAVGVDGEQSAAVQTDVGQADAAQAGKVEGVADVAGVDVDHGQIAAHGRVSKSVAQHDIGDGARERDRRDQARRAEGRDIDQVQTRVIAGHGGQAAQGVDAHIGVVPRQGELSEHGWSGELGGIDHRKTCRAGGDKRGLTVRVIDRANHVHRLRRAVQRCRGDHANRQIQAAQGIETLLDLSEVGQAVLVGIARVLVGANGEFDVVGQAVVVAVVGGAGQEVTAHEHGALAAGGRGVIAILDQTADRVEDREVDSAVRSQEEAPLAQPVALHAQGWRCGVAQVLQRDIVVAIAECAARGGQASAHQADAGIELAGVVGGQREVAVQQAGLGRVEADGHLDGLPRRQYERRRGGDVRERTGEDEVARKRHSGADGERLHAVVAEGADLTDGTGVPNRHAAEVVVGDVDGQVAEGRDALPGERDVLGRAAAAVADDVQRGRSLAELGWVEADRDGHARGGRVVFVECRQIERPTKARDRVADVALNGHRGNVQGLVAGVEDIDRLGDQLAPGAVDLDRAVVQRADDIGRQVIVGWAVDHREVGRVGRQVGLVAGVAGAGSRVARVVEGVGLAGDGVVVIGLQLVVGVGGLELGLGDGDAQAGLEDGDEVRPNGRDGGEQGAQSHQVVGRIGRGIGALMDGPQQVAELVRDGRGELVDQGRAEGRCTCGRSARHRGDHVVDVDDHAGATWHEGAARVVGQRAVEQPFEEVLGLGFRHRGFVGHDLALEVVDAEVGPHGRCAAGVGRAADIDVAQVDLVACSGRAVNDVERAERRAVDAQHGRVELHPDIRCQLRHDGVKAGFVDAGAALAVGVAVREHADETLGAGEHRGVVDDGGDAAAELAGREEDVLQVDANASEIDGADVLGVGRGDLERVAAIAHRARVEVDLVTGVAEVGTAAQAEVAGFGGGIAVVGQVVLLDKAAGRDRAREVHLAVVMPVVGNIEEAVGVDVGGRHLAVEVVIHPVLVDPVRVHMDLEAVELVGAVVLDLVEQDLDG